MSAEGSHHVTVRLVREYEFVAEFNDVADAPSIFLDEPAPLGGGRGPNATDVLAAAVGNCLAASLAYCLRRVRLDVQGLTAKVTTDVTRNDQGRFRIAGIDVVLEPELADADRERFDRCEKLFEDFCTVTASLRKGIPVTVSVKEPIPRPGHRVAVAARAKVEVDDQC
jgi:uncharacterized OsmC-like protein